VEIVGTLRSKFNHSGLVINGITLGQPPILVEDLTEPQAISDAFFIWDDSALPTGEISKDGSVVLDETVG
jgi:hypothetical protein